MFLKSDYEKLRWHIGPKRNKPVIHRIVYDGHGCFTSYSSCAHKGTYDSCITSIVINGILSEKQG
jgi:hypothetical protein